MRARVGRLLRRCADRIDPAGEPVRSIWTFTYEGGSAVRWRKDGRGCPVWYYRGDGPSRAYSEADRDWRSPNEKLADMLATHGEPADPGSRQCIGEARWGAAAARSAERKETDT